MSRFLTITHRITSQNTIFCKCIGCHRWTVLPVTNHRYLFHTGENLPSSENIGKSPVSKKFRDGKDTKDSHSMSHQDDWISQLRSFENQLQVLSESDTVVSGLSKGRTQKNKAKGKKKFEEYPYFSNKKQTFTFANKEPSKQTSSAESPTTDNQNEKATDIIENLKGSYVSMHKRKKKKVKPLFIEHVEGTLDESIDADVLTQMEELDSLLADKSLSKEMRSHIEDYIKRLKIGTADKEQSSEMVWDPNAIQDSLQEAGISNSLTANEFDSMELQHMGTQNDILSDSSVTRKCKGSKKQHELTAEAIAKEFGANKNKHTFDQLMSKKLEVKAKRFQEELVSFVDVCTEVGMLHTAYSMVTVFYLGQKQGSGKPWQQLNIDVYNVLMEAVAKRGSLITASKLYKQITELELKPNLQTYATYLECLGRHKHLPTEVIRSILEDAKHHGLLIEEMPDKCLINEDSWRFVERAILEVNPDFIPDTRSYPTGYNCEMLSKLNDMQDESFTNAHSELFSNAELHNLVEEQIEFEMQTKVEVESIMKKNRKYKPKSQLKAEQILRELKASWKESLTKAFETNLRLGERIYHQRGFMSVMPYMRLLPVEKYVDIMIEKVLQLAQEHVDFSPQLQYIWFDLGEHVYNLYLNKKLQQRNTLTELTEVYKNFVQDCNELTLDKPPREIWQEEDHSGLHERPLRRWSMYLKREVGKFMMDLMMSEVKIDKDLMNPSHKPQLVPALYKVMRYRVHLSNVFEIKPHRSLTNLLKSAEVSNLSFVPQMMPFLAPPIPWCKRNFGADIKGLNPFIRSVENRDTPNEQLFGVFDALNALNITPWRVNQPILDLVIQVFKNGGNKKLSIPDSSIALQEIPSRDTQNMEIMEKIRYETDRHEHVKAKGEEYSLWCSELYKLSIANKYRDRIFWFPHNLDFRGRAYTCSPYLTHIGGDLSRSLLLFGKGKPLGPKGLDWLKIHLINLTALKKRCSNMERLAYANEMMAEIEDSADRPFKGRQWWTNSEDPWQTLAACMEIVKATRSPDPEKYICHLPIHQDGSCNGLQHYAALGRDTMGAKSVNLVPQEMPKDVYSDVVALVEQRRKKDVADGVAIAKKLEGLVQRKVIKQTVMTTVYGVTRYGATQQILKKLKDMDIDVDMDKRSAAAYLSKKTFESLQEMFQSSKQIQDWLVLCAELISNLQDFPEWETPLRFPVLQQYKKQVNVVIPGLGKQGNNLEKPNKTKQKNAIAPNFVHSLDATHMMLTALFCQRAGITFASVHDCYWTHACDVDVMNKICREQFISLHQQPILENLAESLLGRYGFKHSDVKGTHASSADNMKFINTLFASVPERGDLDLNCVLDSTYFFS